MMNNKNVTFHYGAIADTLEKQANEQGFTLGKKAEQLEKIKKAIVICGFHVATESQANSMTKKLHNKVIKSLKELEEE
ncbi:MAG: hypothetical protein ACRC1T_05160 [Clostridium chrysemydis]|uniref:hypothetical protein n=1 Tax=Clostridium chrysemydis TaxID=2665504 RepID=UPI003F311EA6